MRTFHQVDVGAYEHEFVIHFGSERATINAYTLATSLVSLANAIKEANAVLNPGHEIEVVVVALGSGSFTAKLKALYSDAGNLFSAQDAKTIVLSVVAAHLYTVTLAPEKDVNVSVAPGMVLVEHGQERIVVPTDVYNAMLEAEKSERFRRHVGDMLQAVFEDEEVRSIGITPNADQRPPLEIPRPRFRLGILPTELKEDETSREVIEPARLQIVRAILVRSARRWEFVWRGVKIAAPVLDQKFYDDFIAHKVTIGPGDLLEGKLKIYQEKEADTGIFVNKKASSAESVGEFRLGQRAESMVQSDFCTVIGPKAEGFSGRQFCLAVKSLHDAAGELAFGPEPVQQKLSMAT